MKTMQILLFLMCCVAFISGCSSSKNETEKMNDRIIISTDESAFSTQGDANDNNHLAVNKNKSEVLVNEIDLTECFQAIEGCAVIYDASKNEYHIYNSELSEKRASPCSTFKIISALIGLKSHALENEKTVIPWNGTYYSVEEWNQSLTLKQAFRSSCIWYFRQVIDKSGKELVRQVLSNLSYGNCDISQWEGSNTNAESNELNGFWLESSLLISPKEQVEVMVRLFSNEAKEYEAFTPTLKNIMFVDNNSSDIKIYGKTGTGTEKAWFVGFAESNGNIYYLTTFLDGSDSANISGQKAKEIALNIITNYIGDVNNDK